MDANSIAEGKRDYVRRRKAADPEKWRADMREYNRKFRASEKYRQYMADPEVRARRAQQKRESAQRKREADPEAFLADARARALRSLAKPEVRERKREYDRNRPPSAKARKRIYRTRPEVKARERQRGWRYAGLPAPTRPAPATCEACGAPPGKHALHLDHCHKTGKFRGWLCGTCNKGAGLLGDDLVGLFQAGEYLTNHDSSLTPEVIRALHELKWFVAERAA